MEKNTKIQITEEHIREIVREELSMALGEYVSNPLPVIPSGYLSVQDMKSSESRSSPKCR